MRKTRKLGVVVGAICAGAIAFGTAAPAMADSSDFAPRGTPIPNGQFFSPLVKATSAQNCASAGPIGC